MPASAVISLWKLDESHLVSECLIPINPKFPKLLRMRLMRFVTHDQESDCSTQVLFDDTSGNSTFLQTTGRLKYGFIHRSSTRFHDCEPGPFHGLWAASTGCALCTYNKVLRVLLLPLPYPWLLYHPYPAFQIIAVILRAPLIAWQLFSD